MLTHIILLCPKMQYLPFSLGLWQSSCQERTDGLAVSEPSAERTRVHFATARMDFCLSLGLLVQMKDHITKTFGKDAAKRVFCLTIRMSSQSYEASLLGQNYVYGLRMWLRVTYHDPPSPSDHGAHPGSESKSLL